MIESSNFFDVIENFGNCVDNAVDVFLAAKEKMMGEPDRLVIRGTLRLWTLVHASQVKGLGPPPTQSRIVRGVEREQ